MVHSVLADLRRGLPALLGRRTPSEWTGIDWTARTHDVVLNGRRLRYVDMGEGPAILLIHGLGGSWQNWLENIPALAAAGHRVVAVDLPGFGHSDELPATGLIRAQARTLVALLDRLGEPQAVVIGHSMGGLIALHVVAEAQERVRGLVLVAGGALAMSGRHLGALVTAFGLFSFVFGLPGVSESVVRIGPMRTALLRAFVGRPEALSNELAAEVIPAARAPGFGAAVRAAVKAVNDVSPSIVQCPTLVLWGENDRLLPAAQGPLAGRHHPRLPVMPRSRCWALPDVRGRRTVQPRGPSVRAGFAAAPAARHARRLASGGLL